MGWFSCCLQAFFGPPAWVGSCSFPRCGLRASPPVFFVCSPLHTTHSRPRTPLQDATLNAAAGAYAGMDRFAARAKLWADMEAAGLVIKKEPHTSR